MKRAKTRFDLRLISRLTLILFITSILIVATSGCVALLKPKKDTSQATVHVGTVGLETRFLQNAPPAEITMPAEGQKMPFQAGINLENKGAYDIKEGYLLLAVERNYMEISGWQLASNERFTQIGASGEKLQFKLKGRSEIEPVGETDAIFANIDALPLEKQSVTHKSSISATICYDYETTATAGVCIDPDVYNLKPTVKACTVSDISLSGGQGGPISVDKVDVSMLPNGEEGDQKTISPQFVVHISNKGEGIAFRQDKIRDACSSNALKAEEINTITVSDISFSGYSLQGDHFDCNPTQVKLRGTDDKFVCRVKKGVISDKAGTYSTSLQITLKYGYSQSISKDITINRIQ